MFEGNNSYSRYAKEYRDALHEIADKLYEVGTDPSEIGTHSARKGVGTLVAAGCTVSPPIVSICLRMGWSLGSVLGRYFKRADAGDQYVGRTAAMQNPLDKFFASSCAYFDYTNIEGEDEKNGLKSEILKWVQSRLPKGVSPRATKLAVMFFASICYHHDYLQQNMHQNSPFRSSSFFKDVPVRFRRCAVVKYPWNKTSDTPMFTGIPPHVSILVQNEMMIQEIRSLKETLSKCINTEFDERGVGCTDFYTRQIEKKMDELHAKFDHSHDILLAELQRKREEAIEEALTVEGFSLYNVNDADVQATATLVEEDDVMAVGGSASSRKRRRQEEREEEEERKRNEVVLPALKKKKLTPLPSGFQFPSTLTPLLLVQNWFIGDATKKVIPYKNIEWFHFMHSDVKVVKRLKNERQKMGRFMAVVEFYATAEGVWKDSFDDIGEVNKMWDVIKYKHIYGKYSSVEESRTTTLSWWTLYNKMVKKGAFRTRRFCKSEEEWKISIYNNKRSDDEIKNDDRSAPFLEDPEENENMNISTSNEPSGPEENENMNEPGEIT